MKTTIFFKTYRVPLLVLFCVLSIGEGLYSGLQSTDGHIISNTITNFVLSQYRMLDKGEYTKVVENLIEGAWVKKDGEFVLAGLVGNEKLVEILEDDLGKNGWRIRFVTLDVSGYVTVPREEFPGLLKREGEMLDLIDPNRNIEFVHIVELTGHVTGRCTIVDWVRPVPVVWKNNGYIMLIRGMPEVYDLIHNEQWVKPVFF